MALSDNAIAFWDLDTDSGDRSGNGDNGSDTLVTYDGTKATFAGSSYITLPGSLFSSDFNTISIWFMSTTAIPYQAFFSCFTGNADANEIFIGDGAAQLFGGSFSNGARSSIGIVSANTEYHLVLVNSGAGNPVVIYLDASSIASSGATSFTTFSAASVIGARPGGQFGLLGTIRDVGLFSDAKDQAWVTSVYNGGTPLKWAGMSGGGPLPTNSGLLPLLMM